MAGADEQVFHSEAVYGRATRQAMVKLSFGRETALISSENARQLGLDVILTSLAADADAFLVEFLQEKVGVPLPEAIRILADFRQWRIEKGQVEE